MIRLRWWLHPQLLWFLLGLGFAYYSDAEIEQYEKRWQNSKIARGA